MESIVFAHSVDCRVCIYEIRDASERKLKEIIKERKKCRKCQQCERLREVENEALGRKVL